MPTINETGLNLLKTFEGLRLDAYVDPVGVVTVGYGHTSTAKLGQTITEEQAEELLRKDLAWAEEAVQKNVKVPLNPNEFSALVSLVFNIGERNFKNSTTLKRLNAGDRAGAAEAIERWNRGTVNGEKVVLNGLVRRRSAERALFQTPVVEGPPPPPATDIENATNVKPDKEVSKNRREKLSESRTLQGAGAAGAAGAAAVGTSVAQQESEEPSTLSPIFEYLSAHQSEIIMIIGIIVLVAALWIAYARIDDWVKDKR
ncbi:MAG: glycoside hydrolase family protein [Alphaproteobacteria bacterium]|nr:glycoside hydrolase family protein [Alphaproteobacteria bacterium]